MFAVLDGMFPVLVSKSGVVMAEPGAYGHRAASVAVLQQRRAMFMTGHTWNSG
jgi:hypothetical protein